MKRKEETRGRKSLGEKALKPITVRLKIEDIEEMKKRAIKKNMPVCSLVRSLVEKGLIKKP